LQAALLSVSDKTKLLELAKGLQALNFKLIGSGGTAKAVRESGIPITSALLRSEKSFEPVCTAMSPS
jgi:AICAR transformylase/IMP cyclohydrolase PurH